MDLKSQRFSNQGPHPVQTVADPNEPVIRAAKILSIVLAVILTLTGVITFFVRHPIGFINPSDSVSASKPNTGPPDLFGSAPANARSIGPGPSASQAIGQNSQVSVGLVGNTSRAPTARGIARVTFDEANGGSGFTQQGQVIQDPASLDPNDISSRLHIRGAN